MKHNKNKLIAEFMNKETILYDSKTNKPFEVNHTYDSDWNELMLVVKACWEKARDLDIDTATMLYDYNFIEVAQGYRDESYKAVCEFVENIGNQERCIG